MQPPPSQFFAAAEAIGVAFEAGEIERLGAHLQLLLETNQQMNLTAVVDPAAAWERHVLDSLTLVGSLTEVVERAASEAEARRRESDEITVIDIGSGGGFPGIPLAIVMPQVRFTLLEATGKKARFLEMVIQRLALSNASVVNERAETVGQDERWRARFDAVIARAVGPLPVLLELTVPLARIGGVVLAIKGERAEAEMEDSRRALHMLHASIAGTMRTTTGTIVAIEKRRATPNAYPRRPGEPKRAPLA